LYVVPKGAKSIKADSRVVMVRSCRGGWEPVFNGHRVSLLQNKTFWSWVVTMAAQL
jgi:hypothetical protein